MGNTPSRPDHNDGGGGLNKGWTYVRVTTGSFPGTHGYGGSIPAMAVFDEYGNRGGSVNSWVVSIPAGGFFDVEVTSNIPSFSHVGERVRPSYLLLQGANYDICIASLAMHYPDGTRQMITGSDLASCGSQIETRPSRTFVGANGEQPRCFWLHSRYDKDVNVKRISFHLPDFIWSPERRAAYVKDPSLLCRQTPRLFAWKAKKTQPQLHQPIPIFNPPLDYDPRTHYDVDERRITEWVMDEGEGRHLDYSDQHPPIVRDRPMLQKDVGGIQLLSHLVDSWNQTWGLEDDLDDDLEPAPYTPPVRTQPPTLIVSTKLVSAQDQCRRGTWNHTDYVSLSEKIFCDMQSRVMFHTCDSMITENCWNPESQQLQFSPFNNGTRFTAANASSVWAVPGPLFGYAYQNVFSIQ